MKKKKRTLPHTHQLQICIYVKIYKGKISSHIFYKSYENCYLQLPIHCI